MKLHEWLRSLAAYVEAWLPDVAVSPEVARSIEKLARARSVVGFRKRLDAATRVWTRQPGLAETLFGDKKK